MKRKTVLLPHEIVLPPSDYQPTKAELEEEFVPPEGTVEEKFRMFFRPTTIVRSKTKK